ncbi:MAG: ABC transporter ATP-binding protein [Lachnospiraceae bacterium]|nr:ABC transporter ATP-binding protein [Lachnospiraceae bacterium]
MIMGMIPYICIWLVVRELIKVAPDWEKAVDIATYGWIALGSAVGGILIYFFALMCTHLSAFRTATNIRKEGMRHLMKTSMGFFDNNASGLLRNRLDNAAGETETLLAHNLADIVGTAAMFVSMIILLFVFDWRMGLSCLLAVFISIGALFAMMGGKNAKLMLEYQKAQDVMSKAATEYVRGIPVVKVFQQTVFSFKVFKQAIEDYSNKAEKYTIDVCGIPQSINLTFTEGAFVFLVPLTILLAPGVLLSGDFSTFVTNYAFYAIFSAIISTALAKIMFAASGTILAETALSRIEEVMDAPVIVETDNPKHPIDNSVEFRNVSFSYGDTDEKALSDISFEVKPKQTVALVGPSGGGKTTVASLIPRFWDVDQGEVLLGKVNVKEIEIKELMKCISFVFQDNKLFKTSIFENVRATRPQATKAEVLKALEMAQCMDIIEKLPDGIETEIGKKGTYLSGGEKQRIALARAILKDAPIIVLDEATAFADPENEVLIQRALQTLTKDKTVIMIAHRLSTVVNADKIIVLKEGKKVEEGKHSELVKEGGLYGKMWENYNHAVQWKIVTKGGRD